MDTLNAANIRLKPLAVSLSEAAAMIGVSRRTLENYIYAKRLPARKVGRRTVILIRNLEAFLGRDQPSVSPSQKVGEETREAQEQ